MNFRIPRAVRRLRRDDGNVAIEYALLGAIVGLGTLSALKNLRGGINQNLNRASASLLLASGHVDRCDAPAGCQDFTTPYTVGFTNPGSGSILTSGWSNLEAGHTWSTGTNSTMTLDLGALVNSNSTTATLDLYTSAFMAQASQTDVTTTVTINGINVGTISYAKGFQGGDKQVTLSTDAMIAIAQNNGIAVINFQSSASGRPVDYGYNTDGRNLGIAIAAVSVTPGS